MSDPDTNVNFDWDDDAPEVASPRPVSAPPVLGGPVGSLEDNFNPSMEISSVQPVHSDDDSEHLSIVQKDADGNEVITQVNLSLPPLSEDEAREIHQRLKTGISLVFVLLKRMHAGKGWAALGYSSFASYVKEEFNYSRSYAYKLLDQANFIEAIQERMPDSSAPLEISELTTRNLKNSLPELLDSLDEKLEGVDEQDEAEEIMYGVIRDVQEDQREENDFNEDFDNDFDEEGSAFAGGNSDAFEYLETDEDEELNSFLGADNDPSEVVNRLENLYTLLTGLQNASDLASKDNLSELLPLIPVDRREEVSRLVEQNREWAAKVADSWAEYVQNEGNSSEGNDYSDDGDEF